MLPTDYFSAWSGVKEIREELIESLKGDSNLATVSCKILFKHC
jgi:hypothetical protein